MVDVWKPPLKLAEALHRLAIQPMHKKKLESYRKGKAILGRASDHDREPQGFRALGRRQGPARMVCNHAEFLRLY